MKPLVIILVLAAAAAAGCSRKPSHQLDAQADAELRRRSAECADYARAADAVRFADCFSDDAILDAPGLLAGRGPDEIRSELARWMAQPGFRLALTRQRIEGVQGREGNAVGTESGRYDLDVPEGHFNHTYGITWRRDPGGPWRADLFQLDVEEPALSTP